MKTFMHALHAVLMLSLLGLSPVSHADPRHSSSSSKSFKGGFSSQRTAAPPPRAPRQDTGARGGFGSFNGAPSGNRQKSDSALSQRLDRQASETNALRTLDARRAEKEQAARDTRPVPGYENRQSNGQGGGQYGNQYNNQYGNQYSAPAPAQCPDNGMAGMAAGMVLGQIANGAHARNNNNNNNNNAFPGTGGGSGTSSTSNANSNQAPPGRSFFGGVARIFVCLMVLSALGWLVFFLVQKKRRKTAENKPNYTFEGQ